MFFYTINSLAQINEGALNEAFSNLGDSMSIEAFNFDINKIKKFNFNGDTILLDTTLNINKLYNFNYRKKDNFEFIKPNNVGQVYNNLSYEIEQTNYPSIGFNANKTIIQFEDDIYFYDVAYPVTELLFKTVYSQGQLTDVLFTTNVNRKLNFSLSFKALRSLGKYQNSLSGSKNFNFTYNYNSEKFSSKIFYVSQRLEKHENGGLTTISIDDFESKDDVFNERSKLNVKFEDAINIYFKRNFFSKNSFNLTNNNKKLSFNHTLLYSTINNAYDQKTINNYYGELNSGLISAKDNYKFRSIFNKISLNLSNLIFDSIEAGLINFNFEYFNLNNNENKIRENSNLFSLKLNKGFEILNLDIDLQKKINGERVGDKYMFVVKTSNSDKIDMSLKFISTKSHPGLMYDYYDSSFKNIKWEKSNKLISINSLQFKLNDKRFGEFQISGSKIMNYFYIYTDNQIEESYLPVLNQASFNIDLLKLKYNKNFTFGKFSMDNTLLLQKVKQKEYVLNLPKYIFRNSFYISEKIFNNVLEIQSGFNFKIFSKFFADEYNPVISTFHTQNEKKIGEYPIVDFFLNAKIRQTRLFFIFEHINSSLTGNKFYYTPSMPYRDSGFRFGLNWNLFN
ncbi:MAG: putative porin [Bacteroidota bacterium]|nr:putative porin [Bacteroidota bacterium]